MSVDRQFRNTLPMSVPTFQVVCSASVTPTTTTNIAVTGLSQVVVCPGTSAVYFVTIDVDWTIGIGGTAALLELLVDGVAQTATLVFQLPGTGRAAQSKTWRIAGLASGSRTFSAQTRNTAAATSSTVNQTHTLMTIERKA